MSYQPIWKAQHGAEIESRANLVKVNFPQDWKNTNTEGAPGREMYIRRVAWACRDLSITEGGAIYKVGCNWKRGVVGQLSLDALALVNPSGAADKTGGKAGLELIDIIESHGTTAARVGWNDVTQVTIDSGNGGGYIQATDPDTTSLPGTGSGGGGTVIKPRDKFAPEFSQVNTFYRAQEGLQRVGGMVSGVDASVFEVMRKVAAGEITDLLTIQNAAKQVLNVTCDEAAMIQWGWDLANGKTPEQCEAEIRTSGEWKAKHPNG